MLRRLVVLGSTGSIGRQTLEVVRALPEEFEVIGLAGGANLRALEKQVVEVRPRYVYSAAGPEPFASSPSQFISMEEMASLPEVDLVVVATVGQVGLLPTLAAVRAGKSVALANKEVLVMAGELVAQQARARGADILPIDSEHSAIWQCLRGEIGESWADWHPAVSRIILTASGGAFRDRTEAELREVTPAQALAHPTWDMGPKVTVDSATLMNKGFEVIEAHWLFGAPYERIEVVLHRESIVHSLVEYADGSLKAQLGPPDMRLPIQYALTYPLRYPTEVARIDLSRLGQLTFGEVDRNRFPCFGLALEAARQGGSFLAVLSAADDEAVRSFLSGVVAFTDIPLLVSWVLEQHQGGKASTVEEVLDVADWARSKARAWVAERGNRTRG